MTDTMIRPAIAVSAVMLTMLSLGLSGCRTTNGGAPKPDFDIHIPKAEAGDNAAAAEPDASATPNEATLTAAREAKAEAEAQRELAAALETLAAEKQRAAQLAEEVAAAEERERAARYGPIEALEETFSSGTFAERVAAYDAALESDDPRLRQMAVDLAFASDDRRLTEMAIDLYLASDDLRLNDIAIAAAMESGDNGLQAKALAALISRAPTIGVSYYNEDKSIQGDQSFEIEAIDAKNLRFSGAYSGGFYFGRGKINDAWNVQPPEESNGAGSVQRDRISFRGRFSTSDRRGRYEFECSMNASVNDDGVILGTVSCHQNTFQAEVNL